MTDVPPAPIDEAGYRAALRRLPSAITVMTTVVDGVPHAMTVNAFTSVSLAPPLVAVCVGNQARMYDSVKQAGVWGISVLSTAQRALAERFAVAGRDLAGQFDGVRHVPGEITGAPILAGCVSWLEVRTWAIYPGGDHEIVVGEVVGVGLGASDDTALTYRDGGYDA